MKQKLALTTFLLLLTVMASGQDRYTTVFFKGSVSYITSRNIYVKFRSTAAIHPGDTLHTGESALLQSAMVVENKSSSSAVCTPLDGVSVHVGDSVTARIMIPVEIIDEDSREQLQPAAPLGPPVVENDPVIKPAGEDTADEVLFKQKVRGRVSAASYSNVSDYRSSHRMRYAFFYRGHNLNNTKTSLESYLTFRHQLNDSISLADALKVYSLAVRHDFDRTTSLTVGRKINPRFSSMGALDGLQFEKGLGQIGLGIVAGTRPNLQNYSLDLNLLQYGGYVSFNSGLSGRNSQSTLGFIEQTNRGKTDRRFVYFQHSGALTPSLQLFGSFEVDLYQNIHEQIDNSARLTNLYASLRYRIGRKLRLSASYDNRRNIIYYESYRNFIDQLIEDETRQGLRFSINHRAFKWVSWGVSSSIRFQKNRENPSRNLSGRLTFPRIPFINARATLRANFLQTDFLDSRIFGLRLSRGFLNNKLNGELYYRWVDYHYKIGDRVLHQNIAGASLSVRLGKKMSLHLFYEGVLDDLSKSYHRFNTRVIKRF